MADPRSCCPLVWSFVPAATLPHGTMTLQTMESYLMAPMAATEQSQGGFASGLAPYSAANYHQWAWPVEGPWQNLNEQAPHQLPMETTRGAQDRQAYSFRYFEIPQDVLEDRTQAAPPTIHAGMSPPLSGMSPPLSIAKSRTNALRRRRPQAYPEMKSQMDISFNSGELGCNSDVRSEETHAQEVAAELLRQLRTGADAQWAALQRFQHLAFASKASCRAAQLALVDASCSDAVLLASSLQGHVRRATQNKHANYVAQKVVEVLPMARVAFVVDELQGVAHEVARHNFGCRLLCRILEHLSPNDQATQKLLEELLENVEELCCDAYGGYVVRHILEFGLPEHKHRVLAAILPNAARYAKHQLGSHVVEGALKFCSSDDQRDIAKALLADRDFAALASSQFGRHVVRALLTLPGSLHQDVEDALWQAEVQLQRSRFGKGVLQLLYAGSARSTTCH